MSSLTGRAGLADVQTDGFVRIDEIVGACPLVGPTRAHDIERSRDSMANSKVEKVLVIGRDWCEPVLTFDR